MDRIAFKKRYIAAAVALFMVLCAFIALLPASAYGVQNNNMAEIPGIDYNRITQKAGGGYKSYPVELHMGDLTFFGELHGELGLSYEELNQIIRDTLSDKGLTVERVALVDKIAGRLLEDAKLYWADQVISGLLSYISIEGIPYSPSDLYELVVHADASATVKTADIDMAKTLAKASLKEAATGKGPAGSVAKKVLQAAEIPIVGAIANTALVAVDWKSGSKHFDEYLKLLEKNLAVINDFYIECSRRAVALADEKGAEYSCKITFDEKRNYFTYPCTFWGVSNNLMSATLSGELENRTTGSAAGTYSGVLEMIFEAEDFSPVEKNLEKTTGLDLFVELIYSDNGRYKKTSDQGPRTILTRRVSGNVQITVPEAQGLVKGSFSGQINGSVDETKFEYSRSITWRDDSNAAFGGTAQTDAKFTSESIDSIHMSSSSRVYFDGKQLTDTEGDETFDQDPGTVFAPLDATPYVMVDLRK